MKTLVVQLLAAAALSLPAAAAPVAYHIAFTVLPGDPVPSGSFTYDPAAGFSDFFVQWLGVTLDLTSSANAPQIGDNPPTGCDGAASNHAYGFLIMTKSVTGCGAEYLWTGLYSGAGYALMEFVAGPPTAPNSDGIAAAATFPPDPLAPPFLWISGSWTAAPLPEPGALLLVLSGALAVLAAKKGLRK